MRKINVTFRERVVIRIYSIIKLVRDFVVLKVDKFHWRWVMKVQNIHDKYAQNN